MPIYEKLQIFRKLELESYKRNGEGVTATPMEFFFFHQTNKASVMQS